MVKRAYVTKTDVVKQAYVTRTLHYEWWVCNSHHDVLMAMYEVLVNIHIKANHCEQLVSSQPGLYIGPRNTHGFPRGSPVTLIESPRGSPITLTESPRDLP